MNVAIITDGVVENSCVFDDILTAQEFLTANVWPGAEVVIELRSSSVKRLTTPIKAGRLELPRFYRGGEALDARA